MPLFLASRPRTALTLADQVQAVTFADDPAVIPDTSLMITLASAAASTAGSANASNPPTLQPSAATTAAPGVAASVAQAPTSSGVGATTFVAVAAVAQTASPNDAVVKVGLGGAIIDTAGNSWTITNAGQVAINGIADSGSGGVTELVFLNGIVWQNSNPSHWLGKTKPSDTWSATANRPITRVSAAGLTSQPTRIAGRPLVIMPLGDSMTASGGVAVDGGPPPGGYRAPLYVSLTAAGYAVQYVGDQTSNPGGGLPDNQTHHEGIPGYSIETVDGDTTNPGLLDYIQANNILQTYKPNVILLDIGYNNLYVAPPESVGATQAFAFLVQMVQYIFQQLPTVNLIVGTVPATTDDLGTPTADANSISQIGAYNYMILNDLKPIISNSRLSIVDINAAENSYTGSGGVAALIGPDTIHPTVAGFQVMANAWLAGIENIAAPPTAAVAAAVTNVMTVSQSNADVIAAAGDYTLLVTGSNDRISFTGGTNTVSDTGNGNSYVLPAPGMGTVAFTANVLLTGDTLDLSAVLASTDWNGAIGMLPVYLKVSSVDGAAVLSAASTATGTTTQIATLAGAGGLTLADLLAHAVI